MLAVRIYVNTACLLSDGCLAGTTEMKPHPGKREKQKVHNINIEEVRRTAEDYYKNGDYYCSESIVKTIRDAFGLPLPDSAIAMASGFPVGIGGSGCMCGAIAGGVMALGMFFGRAKPKDEAVNKCMTLSKELHDRFRERHKCLCCRVLTQGMELGTQEHMKQCVSFTGEVAEETAKIIVSELTCE